MRKKIWLPLMAALALVLVLCACGTDGISAVPSTAPTETTAPGKVKPDTVIRIAAAETVYVKKT